MSDENDWGLIDEEKLTSALAELRSGYCPCDDLEPNQKVDPAEHKIRLGKWKHTKLKDIDINYLLWMRENFTDRPYKEVNEYLKQIGK